MISRGTSSPVIRRGCIITSRSLSGKEWGDENLEKQHREKPKLVFLLGKLLQVFWDRRGILLIDFLLERSTVNAVYYCQLLDEVKLAYRRKRRDMLIRSAILLRGNARPHTTALILEQSDKIHRKTPEHPPYSLDLLPLSHSKKNWEVITLTTTMV